MKHLLEHSALKLAAVLLMLGSAFFTALLGAQILTALPYQGAFTYQDTGRFSHLLQNRQNSIASACADYLTLEEADTLTYAERQLLEDSLEAQTQALSAEHTWFRFQIKTADGKQTLFSNLTEGEVLEDAVEGIHYATFVPGEHLASGTYAYDPSYYYGTSPAAATEEPARARLKKATDDVSPGALSPQELLQTADTLVIECGVPAADILLGEFPRPIEDEFTQLAQYHKTVQHNFSYWVTAAATAGVLIVLGLLLILWSAGHKAGTEGIISTWQEKIFLEVYTAAIVFSWCVILVGLFYLFDYYLDLFRYELVFPERLAKLTAYGCGALVATLVGLAALLLRTFSVRLKAGLLLESCLFFRLCRWLWRSFKGLLGALPFLWKAFLGFVLYFFANFALGTNARYDGIFAVLWVLLHAAAFLLLCWWVIGFRRLRLGSRAIAAGNMSHRIDTRRLPVDLKSAAEDLNNISAGLSAAVEEQMRSERFKSELITNVSHDLKTPLTSIINYVDLLKTTEQSDPKAVEYIEVLDRKSQRLKKLTEDLVEASKASTGVLNVSRDKIGMGQLLDQALGEWAEKLEARKLSVVTTQPEGETWVYADGRHLWRVVDNLLSNCSKYAMAGTRVYLDLVRGKGQVILSVKNVSREPLNVPPERLMERFVRGEESRTTEGSGLGLSIARSLTELQGGTFELSVDGDLFKAIVTLPQAN